MGASAGTGQRVGVIMKNHIVLDGRRFPVTIENLQGEIIDDFIVLSKEQLRASQMVCQSSKELIHRLYQRQGFKVLDIGKPERKTMEVNMNELWERL